MGPTHRPLTSLPDQAPPISLSATRKRSCAPPPPGHSRATPLVKTSKSTKRRVGGEISWPGRGRPEGSRRGDTEMQRLGGDRVDKEPDNALLPSGKDVHEVEDENGQ